MSEHDRQAAMVRLFVKISFILMIVFVLWFYVEVETGVRTDWISATATYGAEQFHAMLTALARTLTP